MNIENFNWFYSATAQSFAGIIAIFIGFVFSRYVSLSIRKSELEQNNAVLRDKINSKKEQYEPKIKEWRERIEFRLFKLHLAITSRP